MIFNWGGKRVLVNVTVCHTRRRYIIWLDCKCLFNGSRQQSAHHCWLFSPQSRWKEIRMIWLKMMMSKSLNVKNSSLTLVYRKKCLNWGIYCNSLCWNYIRGLDSIFSSNVAHLIFAHLNQKQNNVISVAWKWPDSETCLYLLIVKPLNFHK